MHLGAPTYRSITIQFAVLLNDDHIHILNWEWVDSHLSHSCKMRPRTQPANVSFGAWSFGGAIWCRGLYFLLPGLCTPDVLICISSEKLRELVQQDSWWPSLTHAWPTDLLVAAVVAGTVNRPAPTPGGSADPRNGNGGGGSYLQYYDDDDDGPPVFNSIASAVPRLCEWRVGSSS